MTFEETLQTLENLHSRIGGGDDSVFTPAEKRWISALHRKETGDSIPECGCKNKYTDAVVALLLKLRKRGILEEGSRYHLRAGVLIWVGTECYSRHNITDEIAKAYVAEHPDAKPLFEISE